MYLSKPAKESRVHKPRAKSRSKERIILGEETKPATDKCVIAIRRSGIRCVSGSGLCVCVSHVLCCNSVASLTVIAKRFPARRTEDFGRRITGVLMGIPLISAGSCKTITCQRLMGRVFYTRGVCLPKGCVSYVRQIRACECNQLELCRVFNSFRMNVQYVRISDAKNNAGFAQRNGEVKYS